MISSTLVNVPVIKAKIANNVRKIFFHRIQLPKPKWSGYRKTVSTTAGTSRPLHWK